MTHVRRLLTDRLNGTNTHTPTLARTHIFGLLVQGNTQLLYSYQQVFGVYCFWFSVGVDILPLYCSLLLSCIFLFHYQEKKTICLVYKIHILLIYSLIHLHCFGLLKMREKIDSLQMWWSSGWYWWKLMSPALNNVIFHELWGGSMYKWCSTLVN